MREDERTETVRGGTRYGQGGEGRHRPGRRVSMPGRSATRGSRALQADEPQRRADVAAQRHRYCVTDAGLRLALFLPRVWARTLRPGLATVMPDAAPNDGPLRRAFERLEQAMDAWCAQAKLAS